MVTLIIKLQHNDAGDTKILMVLKLKHIVFAFSSYNTSKQNFNASKIQNAFLTIFYGKYSETKKKPPLTLQSKLFDHIG